MFRNFINKEMAKNGEFDTNTITTISIGTIVKGDISTEGDFRIVGKLIGSIRSTGKVVVGQNGVVEGDIFCQNADLSGTIKGNVEVENLLLLKTSVNLTGNIKTNKLSIESGASFNGNCSMSNKDSKASNGNKQNQKES
ncbi:MAG: polymer-forming cytoskeletal protein [Bacteroidales bacterium]|jgi:cytoskeletal protein CcmA (bactofilin family)|nr:polymer-forming cytoskeletal protein [Bacteroidales bacterium]